jgi:hypothetical protein
MSNDSKLCAAGVVGLVAAMASPFAHAVTFETENVRGSFDSNVSVGVGVRLKSPDCGLVTAGATGDGAPAGCLAPSSGLGDQGNLNYGRGDPFTAYLKGNHELVLKMPQDFTVMARLNWVRDFAATQTTGILSGTTPPGLTDDGLTDDARKDLRFKARVLDLWVSKSFAIGDQQARLRVGNQVINWGESLFLPGGINATNAFDFNRLAQPGVQLKEAVLPAPMLSLASGLGNGFNVEGYVQAAWNKSYLPPVGSYWSVSQSLGRGSADYGFPETDARNSGQWGLSLRWQPRGSAANFGVYAMNYHDKTPVLKIDQSAFTPSWVYPENRKLYGVSANFPVGDWAVGTELSYRPKDVVSVSPLAGCTARDGRCWVDERRLQWHLTGIYSFTPANSRGFLDLVGASTGTLLAELAVTRFPKLQQSYDGDPVAAGYWGWGQETDPTASPTSVGTRTSSGVAMDFSLTYDGTLIEGWQVIPEIYYFRALSGRTPNLTGMFMKGANSTNVTVTFIRNPSTWQFAVNYAHFGGGSSPFDQPLRDRDFVGAVLTRNF